MASIENQLDAQVPKWFAIRTRYKAEKMVVALLKAKGILAYTPINKVVKQYTRKKRVTEQPLMHCYAFVKIDKGDYIKVLQTPHVERFVRCRKELIAVREEEMQVLMRVCQQFEDIEIKPLTFQKGMKVELIGGGMTGLIGTLIDQQGKNFMVALEDLGWGLTMRIDKKYLRPLQKRA